MTTHVAIIGGSFNPPTLSHALMGLEILRACDYIDEVWYLPSNHHPHADRHGHKADRPPFAIRLQWVRAMVNDTQHQASRGSVRLCEIEQEFDTPCYAKDVLERLMERHPNHSFHWVIGSDCFEDLHTWKYIDWLAENVSFLVYPRPGYSSKQQNIMKINFPTHLEPKVLTPDEVIVSNVSSSFIRKHPYATWAMTPLVSEAWQAHNGI